MAAQNPGYPDPLGRHSLFMLTSLPVSIVVGTILGYLAGLGIGGGSLLVLWLTVILNMDPDTARMINLMFFITAAGSVSIFRWKKGELSLKKLLPAITAGCVAAAVFSVIRHYIDEDTVKKLFGILLLITGIRELFYRPRKDK